MPQKSRPKSSSRSRSSSSSRGGQSRPSKSSSASRSSASASRPSSRSSFNSLRSGSGSRRSFGGRGTPVSRLVGILIFVGIVIVIAAVWFLGRNRSSAANPDAVSQFLPAEVSVAEGYEMFQDGALLLDVRTQEEWDSFHVDGAMFIPLDELGSRTSELPQDQDIAIICRTGNRSAEARDLLRQMGFERTTSVAGGMVDWSNAGYPIVGNRP